MDRVAVISTIGLSPPVVSIFVDWMEHNGFKVGKCVIIATSDEEVIKGSILAKYAILSRYRGVDVDIKRMSYKDIDSFDRVLDFMKLLIDLIVSLRREGYTQIYINIAGGRKEMGIVASIIAELLAVSGVYHVITRGVKLSDEKLMYIKEHMDKLYSIDEKLKYYLNHRDIFDEVMYPGHPNYTVIPIPIIPYPEDILTKIINILTSGHEFKIPETKLPTELIERMRIAGLIYIRGDRVIPTDYGFKIGSVLKSIL